MPCGFIRTDNLVQNLRHYRKCKDPACQERADHWAATIEKHSMAKAREMQLPLKMPSKRILDSSRPSCSSVGHKTKTHRGGSGPVVNKGASDKHMAKPDNNKKAKPPAKGGKPKPAKAKKQAVNTGYVAMIRGLLMGQKHSVADAAAAVLKKFPGKQVHSIKRIAFNVAKRARLNPETKNIKWLPSARQNTGYMARIDELLFSGKYTTRQIGEMVSKEFKGPDGKPKSVVSAKKVVRARYKRLRDDGKFKGKAKPLLEADIRAAAKKAERPKAKAKPAKGKATKKAKKSAQVKVTSENGAPLVEVVE
jgi:hypothetical protein